MNAESPEPDVTLAEITRRAYRMADPGFDRWIASYPERASCVKGCAACCELLALVTWPEAAVIAEDLICRGLVQRFAPALAAQARRCVGDQATYFRARVPCAFLEPDKTCAVYSARPTACRFHVVFSDPALCGDRDPGAPTITADTVHVQSQVLAPILQALHREIGEQALEMAPIPIMVIAALRELGEEVEQPLTPQDWIARESAGVSAHHRRNLADVRSVP